ncbi:MAG: hypothetical protein AAB838_01525, partial [Patescibacteria group bacterium]
MAKKLVLVGVFLIFLFLFPVRILAACNPQTGAGCSRDPVKDPANQPDVNLRLRSWAPIQGDTALLPGVQGPTDPNAPRIYTMFKDGTQTNLQISNMYQLNDWNWTTNTVGKAMTPEPLVYGDGTNVPAASLFGFNVGPGQNVLVPQANYDVGNHYQAILEYIDGTSAVVKYTPSQDLTGNYYMIHFEDFSASQDLVKAYNDAKATGDLVWLPAGLSLGKTTGEIKVAMRDSGSFMDLRSIKDWWQSPLNKNNKTVIGLAQEGQSK